MVEYDLREDKNAPVMVTRCHVFNVERFARERRTRMVWALVLSGGFVLVVVVACSASGVW